MGETNMGNRRPIHPPIGGALRLSRRSRAKNCAGASHMARDRRAPIARRFPCGERRAEHNRAFRSVQQRESKRTASIIWAMASM